MHAIDQRKIELAHLFQQRIDELSPGYRIEPGDGWSWRIVDPAASKVLASFALKPIRVAELERLKRLDGYTCSKLENVLDRITALQTEVPLE